jgi:hypothetical protein
VAYVELSPLHVGETGPGKQDELWLRREFPPSLATPGDARRVRWRWSVVRTYLERDIPQFGPRIAAGTLSCFLTKLAHHKRGLPACAPMGGVPRARSQSHRVASLRHLVRVGSIPSIQRRSGVRARGRG